MLSWELGNGRHIPHVFATCQVLSQAYGSEFTYNNKNSQLTVSNIFLCTSFCINEFVWIIWLSSLTLSYKNNGTSTKETKAQKNLGTCWLSPSLDQYSTQDRTSRPSLLLSVVPSVANRHIVSTPLTTVMTRPTQCSFAMMIFRKVGKANYWEHERRKSMKRGMGERIAGQTLPERQDFHQGAKPVKASKIWSHLLNQENPHIPIPMYLPRSDATFLNPLRYLIFEHLPRRHDCLSLSILDLVLNSHWPYWQISPSGPISG